MDLAEAKRRVVDEVDRLAPRLVEVSTAIHRRPELLFQEHFAAELLAGELEAAGLPVERGAYGLETAFAARAGAAGGHGGGPTGPTQTVAILCEYDALPGIGHGCGHNLIAAAGLGAGLAAAAVAADGGGRLLVLGTPAEEGGGGKILMAGSGAFEGVDAAMMVHPGTFDLVNAEVIAIATWRVEYHGRAAHAAAVPHQGRNALDAAVLGYNAVAALRQHIEAHERVHGVFLEAGTKPNIVPDHTVAEWYVRSATLESLGGLKARVLACLVAGATAAGCRMEWAPTCPEYSHLRTNGPLAALYQANSATVGRPVAEPTTGQRVVFSTDMGNVSLMVPSIHPILAVAPPGVPLHSAEMAAWATSEAGHRALVDSAKAMAMTAVDLWLDPGAATRVREAHAGGP